MHDVSVVILLHESGDVVAGCLASLPGDVEVIVVDNASTDGGLATAQEARAGVVSVRLDRNLGFAGGMNAGARRAQRGTLLLLNPDARLEPGALDALTEALGAAPADAIAGPALLTEEGTLHHALRRSSRALHEVADLLPLVGRLLPPGARRGVPPEDPVYERGGPVPYLQGACLALPRRLYEELGGLDEDFFLYSEEEDLCRRARERGHPSLYVPAARVRHLWGTSAGKVSLRSEFHFFRSRVLFYRKRDGELRGRGAGAALVLALALALALGPLLRRLGAGTARSGARYRVALRGCRSGWRHGLRPA